jgi:hypothetical protein
VDKKMLDSIPGLDSEAYLTVRERLQLQEFIEIMDAFEEATNRTQGENIVTSSYVIPTILGLKKHLDSRNWKHNSDLVANLKEEMVRLAPYERKEHYIFASFLDPRIKLRCFERSEKVESRILDVICSIELDSINASLPIASEMPETGSTAKRKKSIFSYMGEAPTTPTDSAHNEVELYLMDRTSVDCPLTYWREQTPKFPRLSTLARKYLAIPASSGPIERSFSKAGKIFTPQRTKMSDAHFSTLMFINCNEHLLSK